MLALCVELADSLHGHRLHDPRAIRGRRADCAASSRSAPSRGRPCAPCASPSRGRGSRIGRGTSSRWWAARRDPIQGGLKPWGAKGSGNDSRETGPFVSHGGVGGWRGARFTPEFVYSSVCFRRRLTGFESFSIRPSPNRADEFPGTRLSSGRISGGRLWASRLPCSLLRSTYPPSPCVRFSRTLTTTRAPSPWGSRPLGDLRISPMSYVRAWFRSSTHPYSQDLFPGISSCGPAVSASSSDRHTMTSLNQLVGSIPW